MSCERSKCPDGLSRLGFRKPGHGRALTGEDLA